MPDLIENFRDKHKGISPKKLVDEYYVLLGKIDECKGKGDFGSMLMHCQLSISLLEPLINEEKREFGAFDIKSIPAIEVGSIFHAIYGEEGQLCNLKEVVECLPELEPWKNTIEEAFAMKALTSKIYQYVKDNEGYLQKKLKKVIGVEDGRLVSRVVYYMALVGKLERKKTGNTYSLFAK